MRISTIVSVVVAAGIALASFSTWAAGSPPADEAASLAAWTKGNQEFDSGNLDAAMTDYNRAIALNPKNGLAYIRRAIIFDRRGNMDAAVADFTTAIDINVSDPSAAGVLHAMRGRLLARMGKPKEALADFETGMKLNPKYIDAYRDRAITYFITADFAKAKPDYEKILAEQPDDPSSLYGLGVISYWERDWKTAAQHFGALRKKSPQNAEAAVWLILAQRRDGQAVNTADFQNIDQQTWPGPVVASLLGQRAVLDKYVEEAAARKDPAFYKVGCLATYATFAVAQAENRVPAVAADYEKKKPGEHYLDMLSSTFESCGGVTAEGTIGKAEIKYLKEKK